MNVRPISRGGENISSGLSIGREEKFEIQMIVFKSSIITLENLYARFKTDDLISFNRLDLFHPFPKNVTVLDRGYLFLLRGRFGWRAHYILYCRHGRSIKKPRLRFKVTSMLAYSMNTPRPQSKETRQVLIQSLRKSGGDQVHWNPACVLNERYR